MDFIHDIESEIENAANVEGSVETLVQGITVNVQRAGNSSQRQEILEAILNHAGRFAELIGAKAERVTE
jgi:hypothetical protein